jgi:hypothetical protein
MNQGSRQAAHTIPEALMSAPHTPAVIGVISARYQHSTAVLTDIPLRRRPSREPGRER